MPTPPTPGSTPRATPETIGTPSDNIEVQLGAQFLHHFSEQLYSSPQKAFEELISNGWDAGADYVDVRISADLSSEGAALCVLDNGVSMNLDGLRELWHIAFSPKSGKVEEHGRKLIGKFGIGKLATYVLAKKLTYICKASDGKIRRVTMDYGEIDRKKDTVSGRLISDLNLKVYEVSLPDLEKALTPFDSGADILHFIHGGIPAALTHPVEDEFGGDTAAVTRASSNTWTLVLLSDLKPAGRELKIGLLKRMLEAALPFGAMMAICVNGERLSSSKLGIRPRETWTIGPDLDISALEIDEDGEPADGEDPEDQESGSPAGPAGKTEIPLTTSKSPFHHVTIPGIGTVTGTVSLFADRITGGKSDLRGASNGFQINVLGRVVNQSDSTFGEKNLSHAAWARFRMAVRADGLNPFLTTDREKFKDGPELRVFRAFLRKVFNKVRNEYDSDPNATMPDGGDVLVRSLGVLSLNPLRNVVSETLRSDQPPVKGLFDDSGIDDRKEKRRSWREDTSENIKSALGQVRFERIDDDSFVKFRISDNSIVVNKEHPFVAEHSRTKAEKELLRTMAMITLLSDVYALDQGVEPHILTALRDYRDRLMRFKAMQSRKSGLYIAKLLLATQHAPNWKLLEVVVSDALRYLGFDVKTLAKPGEPEGIASAYPVPTRATPTEDLPEPPLYSVSFDAKSSTHENASTGNIGLDGVVEHRDRYKADHALVIAPGFSEGALATRCTQLRVTPMVARDLGKLLEYTVEYGAIPLTKLREVFYLYSPNRVSTWIDDLGPWLQKSRPLTIDIFLKALEKLRGKIPDALSAGTLAYACRELLKAVSVKNEDVIALAKGLSILIPDLVGVEGDKIVVNASARLVAEAVTTQLDRLRDDS